MTPSEIEDFYRSPISELFPRLRHGVFHRMSLDSYRKVVQEGFIRPNDGTLALTYGQSVHSYGGKRRYISLFDFGSVDDAQFAQHEGVYGCGWGGFMTYFEPLTVVLELDRDFLLPKLIPNSACWGNGDNEP